MSVFLLMIPSPYSKRSVWLSVRTDLFNCYRHKSLSIPSWSEPFWSALWLFRCGPGFGSEYLRTCDRGQVACFRCVERTKPRLKAGAARFLLRFRFQPVLPRAWAGTSASRLTASPCPSACPARRSFWRSPRHPPECHDPSPGKPGNDRRG